MNRRVSLAIAAATLLLGVAIARWLFPRDGGSQRKRIDGGQRRRTKTKRCDTGDGADSSLPQFIMLLGIPGSGKSTWSREFVFRCDASFTIVSSDEVRKKLCGSINDQTKNSEVWDVVLNQCQGLLSSGRNVILDATNTSTERRRQFIKQLPPCRRFLKTFTINKSIAKARLAKDLERGVERAAVPDSVVDVMYRQFQDSVMAVRDEGWQTK
jgi:predicted kinase